eukprot:PITA_32018
MAEEYESIMKNNVCEVVLRPKLKSLVTLKWLYKIKRGDDGSIEIYKASFVATSQGWTLHLIDVKTVFLHGILREAVYVQEPHGFNVYDRKTHVRRLKKALYGLKQAPKACEPLMLECKSELASEFEMKDLGLMHYFKGLEVSQRPDEVFLSRGKYVVKLLERFRMVECKSMATLMDMNFKKLCGDVAGPDLGNPSEYRQLIRALMFLVNTRTDKCFAVNTLSQFMTDPLHAH